MILRLNLKLLVTTDYYNVYLITFWVGKFNELLRDKLQIFLRIKTDFIHVLFEFDCGLRFAALQEDLAFFFGKL